MSSSGDCADCFTKNRQIEQLLQKLEHAVHTNKMLSQECKRLEEKVKEAKWQHRGSRYVIQGKLAFNAECRTFPH
jgi:hypothetical protein